MTNSSTTTSKVFLITGCSTGLGLSLANAVLKFGHQVIATSRNPVGTPSAVKSVEAQGGTWLPLDVTSSALEDQFKVAFDVHGRIDVLVNNAGIAVAGAVEDFPADGYMAMFETNFFGPVKLTKLLVPYLREQRGGTIVNISSASTWSGQPALAFYASSKASLNGEWLLFLDSHLELKDHLVDIFYSIQRRAGHRVGTIRHKRPDGRPRGYENSIY